MSETNETNGLVRTRLTDVLLRTLQVLPRPKEGFRYQSKTRRRSAPPRNDGNRILGWDGDCSPYPLRFAVVRLSAPSVREGRVCPLWISVDLETRRRVWTRYNTVRLFTAHGRHSSSFGLLPYLLRFGCYAEVLHRTFGHSTTHKRHSLNRLWSEAANPISTQFFG